MASQSIFGRPFTPKVTGANPVIASAGAGDPLAAGVAHAVPISGFHQFSVFVVGAGPVWIRTQNGSDIATDPPSATNCHTYPGATLLGPFDLSQGSETHVVIAKATGGTITGYFINWYRS
jgi:hypothetical protein